MLTSAVMVLTILIGIFRSGKMNTLLRLLLLQVSLAFIAEGGGYFVALLQNRNNSIWFHDIYIIADFAIVLAVWYCLKERSRYWVNILFLLFGIYLAVWLMQVNRLGMQVFMSNAYLYGCVVIVLLFFKAIIDGIQSKANKSIRVRIFAISISMIVFYCGQIPLFGFFNILNTSYPEVAKQLFNINFVLEIIRYLIVAYVFYVSVPLKPINRIVHE